MTISTIGQLLSRDLAEPIEEVIKLDQQDESTVHTEITEYIATDRIKSQYQEILKAMADAPADPTEGVGVWVSGFFGSGKSSFAKNLGYILANRELLNQPASQLFIQQLQKQAPGDNAVQRIADLVNFLNTRFPTNVIMFDVQVDRAVRRATEPIAEIMYTVLLRELDYALDYDVAELEIELEAEGKLTDFVRSCADLFGAVGNPSSEDTVPVTLPGVTPEVYGVWQRIRKGAQRIQRTSAVMNKVDPATYPTQDSWASSLGTRAEGVTSLNIRMLVNRTFELNNRRRPGHAVVFIVDEVGQYVARSAEKIENLRAVVEHFGQESKNRVLAGKAIAPIWVIVTSQEKLDEVVAAIDDKRVDLAKLQDRFKTHIDMAPADIREVATKRVLAKTDAARPVLEGLYTTHAAQLRTHTKLERTSLQSEVGQDEFVQFYPYLPYFITLSIDIVSGIRLQAGAPRHIGGSNRTIIKQAYEMLVSKRTNLAQEPIGILVSLDRIFDLVEGNLSSEKRGDISQIADRWPNDPWVVRTAKAIALLEYVRDVPRTEINLAALTYRRLGDDSPLVQVQDSVAILREAQFIRQTEQGWKLQTAQEKSWTAERNAGSPTPRDQHDLLEDQLRGIFSSANLTRYNYHSLRNFRVGVSWENRSITAGDTQIPLQLRIADGPDEFDEVCDRARDDSRSQPHRDDVFWVTTLNREIDELITELYRSRQISARYEQLRAQNKITTEEASSLATEKSEALRLEGRLRDRLEAALAQGRGLFRGVSQDGATLGRTFSEILKGLLGFAVPDLYPKLDMGARSLKGDEAQEILKAANLTGLPKVFYDPPDGLHLVSKEGGKYVVNLQSPIVKEVADFLAREHAYGNKVTGKSLENTFGGIGFGWEREMIWLVLATLLRAAAIEVTYQGRRYRNHLDPQARVPFAAVNAFRSASFAPRGTINLQDLVKAVQRFESLTGEEVDVEEVAIAQAFQRLARRELEDLLPLEALVRANRVPSVETLLQEYHNSLDTILNSASDDCVNILAGEGASFQDARTQVATIRQATGNAGLAYLNRMRRLVGEIWPVLEAEGVDGNLPDYAALVREALKQGDFYLASPERDQALDSVESAYNRLYTERHLARTAAYGKAVDDIKAQAGWAALTADVQESLIKPLTARICQEKELPESSLRCGGCHANLATMASDLLAVDGLRSNVLLRLQELLTPEEKVERVRVSSVLGMGRSLNSKEEIDEAFDLLRDHLMKLIDAGIKIVLE